MRVRLLFYCPRCESILFRPSSFRAVGDSLRRAFGVYPQRCRVCRIRFYLFKPHLLVSFLSLLDGRPGPQRQPLPGFNTETAIGDGSLLRWGPPAPAKPPAQSARPVARSRSTSA